MSDDTDVLELGPQNSEPLERLIQEALVQGSGKAGDATRIILLPTPQQRADLDAVRELTGARSQTQVMMDALEEYKMSLRLGSRSLGSFVLLDAKLSALEDGLDEDRAQLQRFAAVLSGYQRSFAMFTILHDAGRTGRADAVAG